jgi:uncharacterized protein (DUF1330 family)
MDQRIVVGLAMLAGVGVGGIGMSGLHAQGKSPGAYSILDVNDVTADLLKEIVPKATRAVTSAGGQRVARTDNIAPLLGTPPKRIVIVAFDSVDKAKAWYDTPAEREVNALTERALKARWFIVHGTVN